jgi:ABC-type multidrug transport system fused ATPase/permease subunit
VKTGSESSLTESLLTGAEKSSESSSSVASSATFLENLEVPRLSIHRGQFVSVIGRVGSGKTTFLYSILGEIDKTQGTLSRRGSIAYIPQVSWLRSSTIRDNILFESPFDEPRYNHILKICELESDLDVLPGGDMTEIGEKGVNLSGGQKQRISIARALYANADIYIIDDCLSALDPYVGKNIFYHALKEYLHDKGKTIVFVTNAIHFTEDTDRVIVIERGRIIEDDVPISLKQKHSIY